MKSLTPKDTLAMLAVIAAPLLLAVQPVAAQQLNIAAGPDAVSPLSPGDAAPAFTVYEVDGSAYAFDPGSLPRPTLLITFRGGWCPFCNAQLSGLRTVLPELWQGGMDVLFLSADRPEILYSNLMQDTQASIGGLDYHILSDAGLEAASALGIAYRVPEDTLASYQGRGRDMGNSSIALLSALPLPAIFIVDSSGIVRFAYSNADIRVRLPAEEVRAAALPFLTRL
jgi:peroxiredoxin